MASDRKKWRHGKSSQAKKSNVLRDEEGTFKWEGVRGKRKKKYLTNFSDTQAKAKKALTSDKAYALPFGETFRAAKKAGKGQFRWKGKQYTTQTKAELETGVAEKEKFDREAKRLKNPQAKRKKSWLKTFGESKTLKEFAKKMKARKS